MANTSARSLKINNDFRDLLDTPTEEELKLLESQLVRDGKPRDPLIIWQGKDVIVDGHNRYNICVAHNLTYDVRELPFKDENEVKDWILENQLGRRNLSRERMSYYLGLLYNRSKQKLESLKVPNPDNKPTSVMIAEKFNVDEKTVRRAGLETKGIDTIAAVKNLNKVSEKLAAINNKNTGEVYTKAELQEIGKVKDTNLAQETAKVLIAQKIRDAKVKPVSGKKPDMPKPPVKMDFYPVVFCKPDFDRPGYSHATEEKPRTTESCMVYMYVEDHDLIAGLELMKRWGLHFEGTMVFKTTDTYEGSWTDVQHAFMLIGSKGTMPGLKKGTASPSLVMDNSQPTDVMMVKLIEKYHPNVKRLDMRKDAADGWDSLKKAS